MDITTQFLRNWGIGTCRYNRNTGVYSHFGPGIHDFRVGEEVIHIYSGQKYTILAVHPDILMLSVRREDGYCGTCSVTTVRPANPERILFGFIVVTFSVYMGQPSGSAARYATLAEAQAEVARLAAIGYPGTVKIVTRD